MRRRLFLRRLAGGAAGIAAGAGTLDVLAGCAALESAGSAGASGRSESTPLYTISLAQWSLHRTLRRGELDTLDFPGHARERYGIDAVEYVNQFFMDRARDRAWIGELRRRADDAGVASLLIMCDGVGDLGHPDPAARREAVEGHRPWLEAAAGLGCHSIRVNAASQGSREEQAERAADGLHQLCRHADPLGLNVLVENHGGLSSDGAWLADVIQRADHPRAGTLPDFGNFRVSTDPDVRYDPYRGVAELMPFAHAVSAKSYDFGPAGQETTLDYRRLMRIVVDAGYRGPVGIEYEGSRLSEHDGIIATRDLLRAVRDELARDGYRS